MDGIRQGGSSLPNLGEEGSMIYLIDRKVRRNGGCCCEMRDAPGQPGSPNREAVQHEKVGYERTA